MEMTREYIGFTTDPRDILLSLQIGFSFVRAAVAYAILERISGLQPSSETTAPRYLKIMIRSLCPFTLISSWLPLALFSPHRSPSYTLSKFCRVFHPGLLVPAASMSLANARLVIISAAYAYLSIMFFQSVRHDPLDKNVEEGRWQKISLSYSDCSSEPFSHAAIHLNFTSSPVIQLLNGVN